MPVSKSMQEKFIDKLILAVQSGEVNPLEIETQLKAMEDAVKAVRGNPGFKNALMDEVDKYSEKEFRYGNAIIVKSSRSTYNYKNDTEWNRLDEDKKKREAFLKALDKPMADPETGEIIEPAVRRSSEFLKIRFDDYNE